MNKNKKSNEQTEKIQDTTVSPHNEHLNQQKVQLKTNRRGVGWVIETYIPIKIIQQIENNNTRDCKYLLFHIPYLFMLCDTLKRHFNPSQTTLFHILFDQIKRCKHLGTLSPQQLPQNQIGQAIASAINFQKVPQGYFVRQLGRFVEKYSVKLATFMPYYDAMFRLILRKDTYLSKQTNIQKLDELLKETVAEVRSKYHNYDIQ